jgi:hypothetical protein
MTECVILYEDFARQRNGGGGHEKDLLTSFLFLRHNFTLVGSGGECTVLSNLADGTRGWMFEDQLMPTFSSNPKIHRLNRPWHSALMQAL